MDLPARLVTVLAVTAMALVLAVMDPPEVRDRLEEETLSTQAEEASRTLQELVRANTTILFLTFTDPYLRHCRYGRLLWKW